MRKVLAGFVVIAAASVLAVGCGSSGGSSGSGGTTGGGTGGTTGGGSGGTTGGGGTTGSCTLPAKVNTFVNEEVEFPTMCRSCLETNCCAPVTACANNADCWAIMVCQSNCYSGIGADGGTVPEDDGSVKNDGGNFPRDQCAEDCAANASQAAQDLFDPMDTCWNGPIPGTQCGASTVCD